MKKKNYQEPMHTSGSSPTILPDEPILSIEQVAERLSVAPETIRELLRSRTHLSLKPHSFKVGKHVRFYWSDVQRWISVRRQARVTA